MVSLHSFLFNVLIVLMVRIVNVLWILTKVSLTIIESWPVWTWTSLPSHATTDLILRTSITATSELGSCSHWSTTPCSDLTIR